MCFFTCFMFARRISDTRRVSASDRRHGAICVSITGSTGPLPMHRRPRPVRRFHRLSEGWGRGATGVHVLQNRKLYTLFNLTRQYQFERRVGHISNAFNIANYRVPRRVSTRSSTPFSHLDFPTRFPPLTRKVQPTKRTASRQRLFLTLTIVDNH